MMRVNRVDPKKPDPGSKLLSGSATVKSYNNAHP